MINVSTRTLISHIKHNGWDRYNIIDPPYGLGWPLLSPCDIGTMTSWWRAFPPQRYRLLHHIGLLIIDGI